MKYTFNGKTPDVHESAFIAPGVHLIGDVTIEEGASVWFNSVLRGDEGPISIGKKTNVQDNCTLHLYEGYPLILEDEVSIGHNVILHGCTIKKGALVGMGSTILDGVEIGEQAFIGANTLIPPGKKIPPRVMVMGSPGKIIRELNDDDLKLIQLTIDTYFEKGKQFRDELKE